ncbi:hypothetical protein [Bradyrhizobium sp. S3.2.12]
MSSAVDISPPAQAGPGHVWAAKTSVTIAMESAFVRVITIVRTGRVQ